MDAALLTPRTLRNPMNKHLVRLCVTLLVLSIASLVGAAEKKKKKQASEDSAAAATAQPMYVAGCPDPCTFQVQSHDKKEVVAILQQHAKTQHNMDLSEKDAEAMVKTKEPMKKE